MKIDHNMQQKIISRLAVSDSPVIYTQLKDDDVANSHFSYHLNKLLRQGIVQKIAEDGYSLSVEGARWLNDTGAVMSGKPQTRLSRVHNSLIIQAGDEVLVCERSGQLKATINDIMFPGTLYTDTLDISENIDTLVTKFIPSSNLLSRSNFGFVQIEANYSDKTLRSLLNITKCNVTKFPAPEGKTNHYYWKKRSEIDTLTHPSGTIMKQLLAYTDNPKNQHSIPFISN